MKKTERANSGKTAQKRQSLMEMRKRVFSYYNAPGKSLFQIVVRMSDEPGSLSQILDLLGTRVNLIGVTTYTLNDGSAMLSAFSESISPKETEANLNKVLRGSERVLEADVREGREGLLVDSFHSGLEAGGEPYILIRRDGLTHVFNEVARILGSGGEALLYREGLALGERDAKKMSEILGAKELTGKMAYLQNILHAEGWGKVVPGAASGKGLLHIRVKDCLECSVNEGHRKGCDFLRGYLEGSASVTAGIKYVSTESLCVLKGDDACEFLLTPQRQT